MRTRHLMLALSTGAMIFAGAVPVAAQTPPSVPSAEAADPVPSARAQRGREQSADTCTPGPIADGTYATAERERKNRAGRAPREGRGEAPSAEGRAITEVTLTFQCGGIASDGAFIPTGYRLDVRGECPSGTCDLGTTVAMPAGEVGTYMAVLADETVGFRELRIQARRKAVNLVVRTEVDGQRRPATARYQLTARAGG